MTKRRWALALLLPTGVAPLPADEPPETLGEWRGQWVVVRTEVFSDCMDCVTVNDLEPGGVRSDGVRRFDPGELGRVRDLEVKRQRLEVTVDLAEPLLVSSPRAGFVLFDERDCGLRLRIPIARSTARAGDAAALDEHLRAVFERWPGLDEARASPSWNGRVRQAAPDGHRSTLEAYRAWRTGWAETVTEAAWRVMSQVVARHAGDLYLEGFAEGVEAVDPRPTSRPGGVEISYEEGGRWSFVVEEAVSRPGWGTCEDLADLPLPRAPLAGEIGSSDSAERHRGRRDGRAFAYALQMIAKLRECERAEPREAEP